MTLEEAIKNREDFLKYLEGIGRKSRPECAEAVRWSVKALKALRPVSREQVEKVWRGCEKCNGAGEYSRYAENLTKILLAKYCPHCGRPLTDKAVDMVMERMEEVLKDGKGD